MCEIAANTESGHVRLDNSISLFVLLSVFVYLLRLEKKKPFRWYVCHLLSFFLLLLPTVHSCFTTPKMCRTKSKSKNKKKLQKVTLLLLSSERMGVKGVPLDKHSTMKWDEKRKKKSFKMSDWILTNITTLNCSTGITLPSTEHLYKYLKKKWMKNVTFGDVLVIPK